MLRLIGFLGFGIYGAVAATIGCYYDSWQFWVIFLIIQAEWLIGRIEGNKRKYRDME